MNIPNRIATVSGILALAVSAMSGFAAESNGGGEGKELWVYFGTYTGAKSKGIYLSHLDPATGQLSTPELAGEVTSPSYLAVHPNKRFLYAVNEVSSFEGKKSGAASAFEIDAKTGKLTLLNQQSSGGDGPCHLNVDRVGRNLLVANYGGGSCAVLPIQGTGRLDPASSFMQHRGSSANKQRQEGPHAHGIYTDAKNRFVFVPDLGLDRIVIYKFDAEHGTLTANEPPFAALPPGSGPRHFAFHPEKPFAYAINEMLCTVTTFRYDSGRGALNLLQTVSSLPDGERVQSRYSTAEIEVHPSGNFVYGSNRGHNSISVFKVNPRTGELAQIQNVPAGGNTPRGFGIDPSGRFLIAGNQDSDNVVVFRIDAASGQLTPTGQSVSVGAPVCVTFLAHP